MSDIASRLDKAVRAVCPIAGVSVGRANDPTTWRITYTGTESAAERTAAEAVLLSFDPEAPTVPASVTPYQARQALNAANLRDAAEIAIAAASYDVRDAWEYALTIERNSPFIAAMSAALGLSAGQVDDLFILAATF